MATYNRKHPIQISICLKCGNSFTVTDHPERIRKYCSPECRRHCKIGENNPNYKGKSAVRGDKHQFWKGDAVGIDALHTYIRKLLLKPDRCQCCNDSPPRDLANISGEYKRDVSDWEWLCRRCHMIKDGRLLSFISNSPRIKGRKIKRKEQYCIFCKTLFPPKRKNSKYCSSICSGKHRTQLSLTRKIT